jgi:V8-like Glu-specific endopeptidase
VYVVQVLYDAPDGIHASQGTGFFLKDVGFVTAAHVVSTKGSVYKQIEAHAYDAPFHLLSVTVSHIDAHRDIAICSVLEKDGTIHTPKTFIERAIGEVSLKDDITLIGFPAYKTAQTPYLADGKVGSRYTQSTVKKFEITAQIREGNSGGPVLNEALQLVGMAVEGAEKSGGNNAAVSASEIYGLLKDDSTIIVSV